MAKRTKRLDEAEGYADLTARQYAQVEANSAIVDEFGQWNQSHDANGACYQTDNEAAASGIQCANCAAYEGGQACSWVEGAIAPEGICKLWVIPAPLINFDAGEPTDEPITEAELNYRDQHNAVQAALNLLQTNGAPLYLQDIDGNTATWMETGETNQYYRATFTIGEDGIAKLGSPSKVTRAVSYTSTSEAATDCDLTTELVPLREAKTNKDGLVRLKLIQPGKGASAYYPAEVLKRDGPRVFAKGTHMYVNHQTESEERSRPEGDVHNLAAVLAEDARWDDAGEDGAGLYAHAEVFSPFRERLKELAPHIGVSIRAMGRATKGEVDGKSMPVLEQLLAATSVDFVTKAGAGGKVLEVLEAARSREINPEGVEPMADVNTQLREAQERETALQASFTELQQKFNESQTDKQAYQERLARLEEAALFTQARAVVATTLAGITMPELTRKRLTESLASNPPVKDGKLDVAECQAKTREAAEAELKYLREALGGNVVRGVGSSTEVDENDPAKLRESIAASYERLGYDKKMAQELAR